MPCPEYREHMNQLKIILSAQVVALFGIYCLRYIIGDVLLLLSSTSASDLRMGDEIEGFRVVAACLKSLGVTHMFGVVGIPVVEVDN